MSIFTSQTADHLRRESIARLTAYIVAEHEDAPSVGGACDDAIAIMTEQRETIASLRAQLAEARGLLDRVHSGWRERVCTECGQALGGDEYPSLGYGDPCDDCETIARPLLADIAAFLHATGESDGD